jgi:hypothetical protein
LALASLPLLALYLVLCALLLPLIVARYLFDLDQDFRLRIIVLAFAFGPPSRSWRHWMVSQPACRRTGVEQ